LAALIIVPRKQYSIGWFSVIALVAIIVLSTVDQTLRVAASKLESAHKSNALDGYESGRKERVWEVAEGIWAAMVSYRITYVLPPRSFEKTGQKVRGPSGSRGRRTASVSR
jgi:hypothetical protein